MRASSIVWKLNAVIIVVMVVVIGTSSFIGNRIYERDAVASARDVSRFHLETIHRSLDRLMMVRDIDGIVELIDMTTEHDPFCRNIRLVSHEGAVVASTESVSTESVSTGPVPAELVPTELVPTEPVSTRLARNAWPCNACHALPDPSLGLSSADHDRLVRLETGDRFVAVAIPVLNEARCSDAACHVHPASTRVLGLLQAEFSLERVDEMAARRTVLAMLGVLVAAILSSGATWFTMDRLLGRRIRGLTLGMAEVAGGDLGFRFEDPSTDEVGTVAASFDTMTSHLESTLAELRSTGDYLRGVVESSADTIITVDTSGMIETFNKGAEESLGYRRDEVIGKEIETLFADPSERRAAIAKLEHADNVTNLETRFLTKEGEVREVLLTLSRLRSPDGTTIGTFGISKDVTRENRLRRELMLKEKLAGIGQAVTGIQHAVKNMLSSLKGGAYLVDTGLEEHDRAMTEEGWAMVQDGINNITELSSRMLQYVREWEPELEDTDIGDVVTSVYDANRELSRGRGIALILEVDDGLPPVRCDPRLVRLAVMDLVANAIDACAWKDYEQPESPLITLQARSSQRGSHVEIEVQDNGHGISDEIRGSLFTPFFSTKKRLGTGMGLAMTWRVVRRHGGDVEVASDLARGTTFTVTLPVSGPSEQEKEVDA